MVNVTITGSSPNFTVSIDPPGPYMPPLTVTFTNNSSDPCKVWYELEGAAVVQNRTLSGSGGSCTVNGGVQFGVTAASSTTQPPLSHIIHIGS